MNAHLLFCRLALVGCALLLAAGCAAAPSSQAPRPAAFCPQSLDPYPDWLRVREAEQGQSSFSAAGLEGWPGLMRYKWLNLEKLLQGAAPLQQAKTVNAFFNLIAQQDDRKIWGKEDYWATPLEFVNRGGDCEDYAIAKYYALRHLGVGEEQLTLAGVWNTKKGEGHGILLFFIDDTALVLDNLRSGIVPLEQAGEYRVSYLLNETSAFRPCDDTAAVIRLKSF